MTKVNGVKNSQEFIYKIIVIGDPFVGKTSLLTKFASKKFSEKYIKTIGANITTKKVKIDTMEISLMVWDIAGQEEFTEMRHSYFDGANGVIIVYDVTRPKTLDNVSNWYRQCLKYNVAHQPMVLVGNKIDKDEDRKIPIEEGRKLAEKMGYPFFETSARTGQGVEEMFMQSALDTHSIAKGG